MSIGDYPELVDWRMYYVAEQTSPTPTVGRVNRLGEIDEFNKAAFVLRLNDVGNFVIDADPQAAGIMDALDNRYPEPGRHIELVINGRRAFLGPIQGVERRLDPAGEAVSVFGADQNVWLAQRICQPVPNLTLNPISYPTNTEPRVWEGTAPPNSGAWQNGPADARPADLFTGPAGQAITWYIHRNLGSAVQGVPAWQYRRKITTTLPGPAVGAPVTMAARFQNLLELVQGIATLAGPWPAVFAVNAWGLDVRQPLDRGAIFSTDMGNIKSYVARQTVDDVNLAYVAGQGEGERRQIAVNYGYGTANQPPVYPDLTPTPQYGWVENMRDRRDTNDWAMLAAAAVEDCRVGIKRPAVTVAALDTATQRFGRDYELGDLVTVRFQGQDIQVLVTALTFQLEPGRPPTVTPTLGTETAVAPINFVKRINQSQSRLTQLERR